MEMKIYCFRHPLYQLLRLNRAKQEQGTLSGFEPATQRSEIKHTTSGLPHPRGNVNSEDCVLLGELRNMSNTGELSVVRREMHNGQFTQ